MRRILFTLLLAISFSTVACVEVSDISNEELDTVIDSDTSCTYHDECESGVCDHYYKDSGNCAVLNCNEGDRADNNKYYCDENSQWEKSKAVGDNCNNDYECFQPSCFMNPSCELTDIPRSKAVCQDNVCALEVEPDECIARGLTRVLQKEYYWKTEDGTCLESLEQRILPTVCIACGDNLCDEDESECSCPQDCDPNYLGGDIKTLDLGLTE